MNKMATFVWFGDTSIWFHMSFNGVHFRPTKLIIARKHHFDVTSWAYGRYCRRTWHDCRQPTSNNITAVRHVTPVSIHAVQSLLSSRNYDLALDVRITVTTGELCSVVAEEPLDALCPSEIFLFTRLDGLRRWNVDRYASAGKRVRDLDLCTYDLENPSILQPEWWEVFLWFLVRILSVVRELLRSENFHGGRCLTLTFDPMTLKMSPVSRGPGNE